MVIIISKTKEEKKMDVTNDMDKKEKTKRRNFRKKFIKAKSGGMGKDRLAKKDKGKAE
jgi:hypothetical protein